MRRRHTRRWSGRGGLGFPTAPRVRVRDARSPRSGAGNRVARTGACPEVSAVRRYTVEPSAQARLAGYVVDERAAWARAPALLQQLRAARSVAHHRRRRRRSPPWVRRWLSCRRARWPMRDHLQLCVPVIMSYKYHELSTYTISYHALTKTIMSHEGTSTRCNDLSCEHSLDLFTDHPTLPTNQPPSLFQSIPPSLSAAAFSSLFMIINPYLLYWPHLLFLSPCHFL